MSNQQPISPQKLSGILEDSITSLLTSTPTDPLAFLTSYFNQTQQPNTPSSAFFKLSQLPYTHPNFSECCYQVFSQNRENILDGSDTFLDELYSNISGDTPNEITKILTKKLQLTPPINFKSFQDNIQTCYKFHSYIATANTLYSHLSADKEYPPQETMLEAIDVLKGELVMLRKLADTDKYTLVSCIQDLVLENAGASVSRKQFIRMLAMLYVQTL